jgi:hypothetical protein
MTSLTVWGGLPNALISVMSALDTLFTADMAASSAGSFIETGSLRGVHGPRPFEHASDRTGFEIVDGHDGAI